MEEGKLKRKKISAETTVEILFFLFAGSRNYLIHIAVSSIRTDN